MPWTDEPAVVVNGQTITLGEVISAAKFYGDLAFIQAAQRDALIRQEAAASGIEVSAEELQAEANAFRSARGLHGARETMEWLAGRCLTLGEWEIGLEGEALARKIREVIVGGRVEEHFAQHLLTYSSAEISQLLVADEDVASELNLQITEEGADFHALARRHSLDAATRMASGYRGTVRRGELSPAAQAAVFGGREGGVSGPFRTREGWWLYQVEKLHPPVLDEAVRERIAGELFEEWLLERRKQAEITVPLLAPPEESPEEPRKEPRESDEDAGG